MKRIQSILCATVVTLAMSSATLAGNISGRSGNISGITAPGNISGISAPGNISGITGNISGLEDELISASMDLLTSALG